MKVSLHDVTAGRLELDESSFDRFWNAGLFTTVGAFMAGIGLKLVRWVPGPAKLVPLAVATAGGASATLGVMSGLSHHNISFERGQGVRLRWRFGRGRPRELRVAQDKIAAFEVVHRTRTTKENDIEREQDFYLLMLVDIDGKSIALEEFGTRTQAKLRQQMVEQVLGRDDQAVDARVEPVISAKVEPKVEKKGAPKAKQRPAPKKSVAKKKPLKKKRASAP